MKTLKEFIKESFLFQGEYLELKILGIVMWLCIIGIFYFIFYF